ALDVIVHADRSIEHKDEVDGVAGLDVRSARIADQDVAAVAPEDGAKWIGVWVRDYVLLIGILGINLFSIVLVRADDQQSWRVVGWTNVGGNFAVVCSSFFSINDSYVG